LIYTNIQYNNTKLGL